jgi:hypothetical protein
MLKYLRIALSAAALLLVATDAAAICTTFGIQVYVGDKASDSTCTYNSIQEALTASASYTCPATIRITREHTYTSQHLTVTGSGHPLYLEGEADGVTCYQLAHDVPVNGCYAGATQPLVTIDGNNTAGSVLTITGNSNIILCDLTITRGSADASLGGGGIQFNGTGSLYLSASTVSLNYAGYGGGINVNGNGGAATLTLGANSLVILNTAEHDGGGIRLTGQARLFALQPYTYIFENHADNGYGGGIEVVGPAQADIGSPGYNGAPVIDSNTAAYGGGIAMDAAPDDANVTVRIFSTDPKNPVQVSNNTASHTGGAVWMHPFISGISDTVWPVFCAFDFRLDHNFAQEGTAIYSDTDYSVGNGFIGGDVYLNSNPQSVCNAPEGTVASLGAVQCGPGVVCNTLNNNVAEDLSNDPKPGAVILLQDGGIGSGSMTADRFTMSGNTGGHAIRAFDFYVDVSNCLIADNTFTAERIRIENDGDVGQTTLDGCTFEGNSVGAASVISSAHALSLVNTIIDEPDVAALQFTDTPANLSVAYVLSNDTNSLPFSTNIVQGAPDYVNAAVGDYHLKPTSIGVDFAPATGGHDLDRRPRDVDLTSVPNYQGPRDIGAYERQNRFQCGTSDSIFCNGYEYSW